MLVKLFLYNVAWYVAAVVVADLPPILLFFLMHRYGVLGALGPQIVATVIFFALLCGQAFLHLRFLNRKYPDRQQRNPWLTILVTVLTFATFWLIVLDLILWASSRA